MGFPVDVSESSKESDLEGNQNQIASNSNGGPVAWWYILLGVCSDAIGGCR